jgi:hypothetical protein
MTKLRILAIDNTANHIFTRQLKSAIDFTKLYEAFKPQGEDDVYLPWYFLQLRDGTDIDGYLKFVSTVESIGWAVDRCINRSVDGGYGGIVEAMSMCIKVTDLVGEWFGRKDNAGNYYDIELVLCVNHLSYYKLMKELKLKFEGIKIKLVCNVYYADELLITGADQVIDAKDLNIAREKV